MGERTAGAQSVSGISSNKETNSPCTSSQTNMDITDNLVSRLNIRLDALDLYTTEMFEDELFLARRYMVPWRFRRNEKLSKRWKILYQQYMCEEMLVAFDEQNLPGNQDVSKVMLEVEDKTSDLSSTSDTCTADPGSSIRVIGKGQIYPSRFKKFKAKPDDTDLLDTKSVITASNQQVQDHSDTLKSDSASAEADDVTQSSNDPIESSIGDESQSNGYILTSVKSSRGKNPSSANFSSDSGFEDYKVFKHPKKSTRQLSSSILKRLDDMTKIYEDRKNISDIVRMKTVQRLQDLKVKVEIAEKSNRTILALRHPNSLRHVSKF